MKHSLSAELFKFTHQKTASVGILTLLLLMIYSVLTTNTTATQVVFEFGAVQWIPIIIIAVASAFFDMEYRNRTILILLYKNTNHWQIYLAKLLIVWLYSVILTLIATFFTIVLKSWLVGSNQLSWSALIIDRQTQLSLLIGNVLGTLIYALFIVTLSFMLIMLLKLNAAVIGVGLALGFLGAGFSIAFMKSFITLIPLFRWNPLNMIFITQQLANPSFAAISHLSNGEIIVGNLIYSVIFTILGYDLFKKRRC